MDLIDSKKFSTEFSHTRFLVPSLMDYNGWALFIDADMLFLCDVEKLFALCDDRFAAMVVKHNHFPVDGFKMDGREQLRYHRKNWSSFVLWNCGHEANKELTKERVNFMTGRDLHAFSWLEDSLIGALPYSYNYISGVSPKLPPERGGRPDVVHYTDGGPWFENCKDVPYAEWWVEEYEDLQKNGDYEIISDVPATAYEYEGNKKSKKKSINEYAVAADALPVLNKISEEIDDTNEELILRNSNKNISYDEAEERRHK